MYIYIVMIYGSLGSEMLMTLAWKTSDEGSKYALDAIFPIFISSGSVAVSRKMAPPVFSLDQTV